MRTLFKVIIELNSNGEVEVMTNTDDLVEVIIKNKVTHNETSDAHRHNNESISAINTAFGALGTHLNDGVVESDYEDYLIRAYKELGEALGKEDERTKHENHTGLVTPIAAYGIREKYKAALERNDGSEVLDVMINNHVGIDPKHEFHVRCFDGIGWGYSEEARVYIEMRYPRFEELTEQQVQEAKEYRGHDDAIDESDVMLIYGNVLYYQEVL
jgi:hypothetical protein